MKKLCVFFFIPQIIFTSFEYQKEPGPVTVARPISTPLKIVTKPSKPGRLSQQPRARRKSVNSYLQHEQKTQAEEINIRKRNAKKTLASDQPEREAELFNAREETLKQREKQQGQYKVVDQEKNKEIKVQITDEQRSKIENIKKGFEQLKEDVTVRDIFQKLNLYDKFQKVMDNITNKSDEQVTQEDLNSVQDFLKEVVKNKDELANIDGRIRDKFLEKFTSVIQENFSKLSSDEMVQFLSSVSQMTAKALESQEKKSVPKKFIFGSTSYDKPDKQEQRKSTAKSGMPSSSVDMLGMVVGLSFIAGIFVLMGTLANQN